jgi:formylglycine-generating enzyme required for sulfatase activity
VVADDLLLPAGFVVIPAGPFLMGDALDGMANAPVHEVTVSAFYMGKTEVTGGEWDEVSAWTLGRGYTDLSVDLSAGWRMGSNYPVTDVRWWDAIKWCNARSEKEGLAPCYTVGGSPMRTGTTVPTVNWSADGYRLPTEAEWEKAARGGLSGKRFPWGDTIAHSDARYFSSSFYDYDLSPTRGSHPGYGPYPSPAGSFPANAYGLQDMAGNVCEWCWDWYGTYASGAQTDPRGPTYGGSRVYRGGGWDYAANFCRAANRLYSGSVAFEYNYLGFRVVRSLVALAAATTSATTSDLSVDTRDPWSLFSAAEMGLAVGDVGLVSLSPLDKLLVVGGVEAHDGVAALKIMAADGTASYAERSIEGPAVVSFWWRVSSEDRYDFFTYSVDGVVQESISGNGVWLNRSLSLGAGRHALRWTYRKDNTVSRDQDAGYLDEVVIVDAYRNLEVRLGESVVAGSAALDYGTVTQDNPEVWKAITLKNTGTVVTPFTASLPADSGFVFANGQTTSTQSLPAGQEVSLSLGLQTSLAGSKTALLAITAAGSRTDPPAIALSGLIQARILQVGGSGLVRGSSVNSGTAAAWETATTSLPGGASGTTIKTGSTPDSGHSTIGARFDGPGLLRWQWKVSAQKDYDWLVCEVNGVEVAGISTTAAAWQSQVIQIPAWAEARWIYRKDASNQSGTDSGYLAEVRFDKFTAAPVSFIDWSAAQGGIAPLDLTGPGKIQGVFAWLGGFDPATGPGEGQYLPTVSGGFYRYRYAISKTAAGRVQPQASSDLTSWNSRGLSQTVLSETPAATVVELAIPAEGKCYIRLKTGSKAGAGDAPAGFALIPAGAFLMGDSLGEGYDDEFPVRQVNVSAFYMGKTEVTKGEWDEVRAWAMGHGYTDLPEGTGKAANHPVRAVSWWDVVKWCNARSEREGLASCYTVGGSPMRTGTTAPTANWAAKGYRLPTEAEWEKAARGGLSEKRFPWGDTISHSQANYNSSSDYAYDVSPTRGSHPSYGGGTSPAGSFAANAYGLQDMEGNVLEWCWDWDGLYASGAQSDPRGAATGGFQENRVCRGGAWWSTAKGCRSAARNSSDLGARDDSVGFRVVRSSVP